MYRKRRGWILAFSLVVASFPFLAGPSPLLARQPGSKGGEAMITMDFQDVDLTVLIKFISELTGKNFILDDKVKGKKVTIISPTKISKEEAYMVFQSILDIKGLATVPSGKVIKIVPAKDAIEKNLQTVVGAERAPVSDTLITRLVNLKFVDPEEMVKILKPLMSRESKIDAYPPTNTLILTDTASNIARLMRILRQLDVKADEMVMDVIPLEYASAEVLAGQMQEILQTMELSSSRTGHTNGSSRRTPRRLPRTKAGRGQGFTGKIIADDRTNSLVILSTESQMERIRELVHKLDYDTPRAYGNINVYYLEYANAEDTAKVLSDLVSGAKSLGKGRNGSKGATPASLRTMTSFEGEVNITADTATNSLLIVATPRDYQTLKNVIEKLDIRRKQVYVEAVIMEIQPSFLQDLGMEYRGAIPLEGGNDVSKAIMGGTNYGLGANQMIGSTMALSQGAIGEETSLFPLDLGDQSGLTLGGVFDRVKVETSDGKEIYIPANVLVIHALHRTTKANILSTPHLIAMDNEEAEIVVGRNVPFITSTSQTTVSTVTQVQRESVGITLRFTPQITEGDYIKLQLYEEISALIDSPIGQDPNRVGPTTSERKTTNVVLVRDGQTIIVGGLMEDRVRTVENEVPWLGDIPVLGWLFRYNQDIVEKQNLLIFLTPTIIREDQDVQRLFEEKKRKMLEYKDRHNLPVKYLDVRPFEKKKPLHPPASTAPNADASGKPGDAGGAAEGGASAGGPTTAERPKYKVTIKGAERLDTPELPAE